MDNKNSPDFKEGIFGGIKTALIFLWELIKVAIISLAIILPIRYFLVQPFYVKGQSMEPNFLEHDYLLIDELSFRLREPQRGETVIFRYPRDPSEFFIKRIVGMPGEHLMVNSGKVFIVEADGKLNELTEPYLSVSVLTSGNIDITLKNDEYYLLGDNRDFSLDSRNFGPIKKTNIIGRAWIRAWPVDRWIWFSTQSR